MPFDGDGGGGGSFLPHLCHRSSPLSPSSPLPVILKPRSESRSFWLIFFQNFPGPFQNPSLTAATARCYERWCGWVMMSCVGGAITGGELHSPVVN